MMSIYSGVYQIYTPHHSIYLRYPCISVHLPSLLKDVIGGNAQPCLEIHLEAVIERERRCTSRPRDWVNSEMYLEAVIEWVWRCTWRSRDRVNSGMPLEAMIERVWWCTGRPRSSECSNALGSRNWSCWEIHLEAMIDQDWRSTWRQLIWRQLIWRQLIWRRSIWRQSIWRQWI